MADYKLSNTAIEDIKRIYVYGVETFGESQADLYFSKLFEYFDIIAENPFSFPSVDYIKINYRRCVYKSDSIYYRITDSTVEIMAIIGMQDTSLL